MIASLDTSTLLNRIEWLGHASFRIVGPPIIYIDPWKVTRGDQPADVILISHDHYDHCSPADIEKLRGPETIVVGNRTAAALLEGVQTLRPWQVLNVGRACIKAIPAHNTHHPREAEHLGFVISIDHHDIYYAGDTDPFPEMTTLRPDIAILPVGGRQTMSLDQAVQTVRDLRPRIVIPSHWGSGGEGGSLVDVKALGKAIDGLAQFHVPEKVR